MHRLAVELHHWMTDKQFADLFAIAQLSPGPNVIIVTLIGYQAAGLAGAAAATLAMCGPTCVLAYLYGPRLGPVSSGALAQRDPEGLVPVSIGLIAASALILALAADHSCHRRGGDRCATATVGLFHAPQPVMAVRGRRDSLGFPGYI